MEGADRISWLSAIRSMKATALVLKKRFPNLTTDETVELASQIVEAIVRDGGADTVK